MKDNLFEMLMNLFEASLTKLQKSQLIPAAETSTENESLNTDNHKVEIQYIKSARSDSTRIFTDQEQIKLTKASYQFLKRMRLLGVLNAEVLELIMNQIAYSESNIVTLEETKWTIRQVLSTFLNEDQIAFLDLVLYQKEDELIAH